MVGPISLSPMARAFPNLHVMITTSILLRNWDVSRGQFLEALPGCRAQYRFPGGCG